jgi:hypothetical protein
MRHPLILGLILLGWAAFQGVAESGDCNRFVVTASDGYTNVRSQPRVTGDNVVGAVPSGAVLDVYPQTSSPGAGPRRWHHVQSPVPGWIHDSQLTAIGCEGAVARSRDVGLNAVVRLARQARKGDNRAAATFLALARGVDGALAEVYADEIGDWAGTEPSTLATALKAQPEPIRAAALEMVALGLEGASLEKRGRFRIDMLRPDR